LNGKIKKKNEINKRIQNKKIKIKSMRIKFEKIKKIIIMDSSMKLKKFF
jgi:hypothetical protein